MGVTINETDIRKTLGLASGQQWQSTFLDETTLQAAYNDPSLSSLISSTALARQAEQWQMSQKFCLSNFAPVTGIAPGVVDSVLTLAPEIFSLGQSENLSDLRRGIAKVGIGAAVSLMSAIPVAGPIVKAIADVANLFFVLSRSDITKKQRIEILPPEQEYKKASDEFWGRRAVIEPTRRLDWTSIYLPRFAGAWTVKKLDGGKLSMGPHDQSGGGSGMIPNTRQMTGIIQLSKVDPRSTKSAWFGSDVGSFYPGSSQAAFSLLEMCNKPQTQLYCIDVDRIKKAWEDYYTEGLWLAAKVFRGAVLSDFSSSEREDIARAFLSQLTVGAGGQIGAPGPATATWTPGTWGKGAKLSKKNDPNLISKAIVKPWAERIRKRQVHFLGSITGAAYTSPNQPAFSNPAMRSRLDLMRAELVSRPAIRNVDAAAVIDPSFRQVVFDKTTGSTFGAVAPKISATEPFEVDPPPDSDPGPPQGGTPFGSVGGSSGAAIALAAVAAALLIRGK